MEKSKRQSPKISYVFTSYAIEDKPEEFIKDYRYLIYQKEKCPKTGKLHYQGYVYLKNRKRKVTLCNASPKNEEGKCLVWYTERRGTHTEAKTYSDKADSYVDGPWEFGSDEGIPDKARARTDLDTIKRRLDEGEKVEDLYTENDNFLALARYGRFFKEYERFIAQLANDKVLKEEVEAMELRPWQQEAVERLDTQQKRIIHWYYDERGDAGKTELCKWLYYKKNAFISYGGKNADIAQSYGYQKIVVFNFTREKREMVNYSIIESFNDGFVFLSKWDSKMLVLPTVKIVVFADFMPEVEKMSRTKLVIFSLYIDNGVHKTKQN